MAKSSPVPLFCPLALFSLTARHMFFCLYLIFVSFGFLGVFRLLAFLMATSSGTFAAFPFPVGRRFPRLALRALLLLDRSLLGLLGGSSSIPFAPLRL